MQNWRRPATDGTELWISCKRQAFLSSFSRLQVIQNKRPWCSASAFVTAGLLYENDCIGTEFFLFKLATTCCENSVNKTINREKFLIWNSLEYFEKNQTFISLIKWIKNLVKWQSGAGTDFFYLNWPQHAVKIQSTRQ